MSVNVLSTKKYTRDNPEWFWGWFWVHCSSKKFERMAREAMDVFLRVLKESNKGRFDSYSARNGVLIISHITFRDCCVNIFPTTFLEIALYLSSINEVMKWEDMAKSPLIWALGRNTYFLCTLRCKIQINLEVFKILFAHHLASFVCFLRWQMWKQAVQPSF